MAPNRVDVAEVLFYRVGWTAETNEGAPDVPLVLVLPEERDPRTEVPRSRWAEIRTEPGRWYRFPSRNRPRRVPLTAEQAEWFRAAGWNVEDPRPSRGKAEHEAANRRRARIAEQADLPRRREAALEVYRQSMRAADEERIEQLWLPRLYRKIPRQLNPEPWRRLYDAYLQGWCKSREACPRKKRPSECVCICEPGRERPEGHLPDFDFIRCIVFGWADGTNQEELEHWVRRWREELHPAIQSLGPVTSLWVPGPELLAYVTRTLPEIRLQLDRIVEEWPDSPLALEGLLEAFRPEVTFLAQVKEHRRVDPSKDELEDQGRGIAEPLAMIASGEELAALDRLTARGERLAELVADAEQSLSDIGWEVSDDDTLKGSRRGRSGRKSRYLTKTIRGIYCYLRPIYRLTFGDHAMNPGRLRKQISLLLSPYFEPREIRPTDHGPIWHAINNLSSCGQAAPP
jgi:hypothetical protein